MHEKNEHGSFLGGFTVGLFAGAAGYFMFGTQKGKKIRERLTDEWENARMEAGDKGFPNMSLREMIGSLVNSFQDSAVTEANKQSPKKASKAPAKENKPKFKGT